MSQLTSCSSKFERLGHFLSFFSLTSFGAEVELSELPKVNSFKWNKVVFLSSSPPFIGHLQWKFRHLENAIFFLSKKPESYKMWCLKMCSSTQQATIENWRFWNWNWEVITATRKWCHSWPTVWLTQAHLASCSVCACAQPHLQKLMEAKLDWFSGCLGGWCSGSVGVSLLLSGCLHAMPAGAVSSATGLF